MGRTLLTALDLETLPLPAGMIFFWAGTAASIPAGWQAESALVGNIYFRGNTAGVDPGGTGGAATHSHSGSHSSAATGAPSVTIATSFGGTAAPDGSHTHTIPSDTPTSDAPANGPTFLDVLPVKTSLVAGAAGRTRARVTDLDATCLLPARMIGCWLGTLATIPAGWALCDGGTVNTYVTPNLVDQYARGVATTGTTPGTTGGADGHTHSDSHAHGATGSVAGTVGFSSTGPRTLSDPHTHTTPTHAYTSGSGSNDPSHKKVAWTMFVGYGASGSVTLGTPRVTSGELDTTLLVPRGMMLGYYRTGTLTAPAGYAHADGAAWTNGTPTGHAGTRPNALDRLLRSVATAGTNAGATGGGTTHTHAGGSHTHTGVTGVDSPQTTGNGTGGAGPVFTPAVNHTHGLAAAAMALNSQTQLPAHNTIQHMVRD